MQYVCDEKEAAIVLSQLKSLRKNCLYLYCNLSRYGIRNSNFKVLINDKTNLVIGQYYGDSIHIMAQTEITDDEACFISAIQPRTVFSSVKLPFLQGYNEETTGVYMLKAKSLEINDDHSLINLKKEEMKSLTEFLYLHSLEYQRTYDKTKLYQQLTERLVSGYCRYFGLFQNEELIGCAFTKAETEDTMIVGGILVSPDYRGRGFGKLLCKYKAAIAVSENKEAFCFIDDTNTPSIGLHTSCGYRKVSTVFKYTLK